MALLYNLSFEKPKPSSDSKESLHFYKLLPLWDSLSNFKTGSAGEWWLEREAIIAFVIDSGKVFEAKTVKSSSNTTPLPPFSQNVNLADFHLLLSKYRKDQRLLWSQWSPQLTFSLTEFPPFVSNSEPK